MRVQVPSGWASGLKWGAIIGALLYVVGLLLQFFSNALVRSTHSIDETQHPILLVPTCLGLFILLFGLSAAGYYTGRETGRAGLGALAGVVAFIAQYILDLIYTPAAAGTQTTTTTAPAGANMTTLVLAEITSIVLILGIAACMGWLGGRPGARRSPLAAQLASAQGPIAEPVEPQDVPSEP